MKKISVIAAITAAIVVFSCHKAELFPDDQYDDRLSGGNATAFDLSSTAFTNAVDGLNVRDARVHEIGDQVFSAVFTVKDQFPGLGPIFNNISCISCHRNDGIGLPTTGASNSGLLFRLSIAGQDEHGGPLAVPGYGTQLQDRAIFGATAEGRVNIIYADLPVTYPDGTQTILHQPAYTLQNAYLAMPGSYMLSPRLAPPVFGLGLLENIPEQTILSFVDAGDGDHDGISGRANYVYDPYLKKMTLGRFGWKANTPSLLVQVATAYQQDMGVTCYVQPTESATGQSQMNGVDPSKLPELADTMLNHVTYYIKTLAVPARRNVTDSVNRQGERLFTQLNCSGCHRPTMQTGVDVSCTPLSNQRIHPYTDLLVHDMGPGLADNRPDYLATGTEWRTSPLWGVGLLEKTTGGTAYYLHDGRAKTLEEAILWHGGEATNAKTAFMLLSKSDRDKVIKFLQSL